MQYNLDPRHPTALACLIVLREAGVPYRLANNTDKLSPHQAPVRYLGPTSDGERRIDAHSLLEMLLPAGAGTPSIEVAQRHTITASGLLLLNKVASHICGDPVLPLTERLLALLTEVERRIPAPAFAPEQFTYVPAEYFDGHSLGPVDVAFAALFSVAQHKLPLDKITADLQKTVAWRRSLLQRPTVAASAAQFSAFRPEP